MSQFQPEHRFRWSWRHFWCCPWSTTWPCCCCRHTSAWRVWDSTKMAFRPRSMARPSRRGVGEFRQSKPSQNVGQFGAVPPSPKWRLLRGESSTIFYHFRANPQDYTSNTSPSKRDGPSRGLRLRGLHLRHHGLRRWFDHRPGDRVLHISLLHPHAWVGLGLQVRHCCEHHPGPGAGLQELHHPRFRALLRCWDFGLKV